MQEHTPHPTTLHVRVCFRASECIDFTQVNCFVRQEIVQNVGILHFWPLLYIILPAGYDAWVLVALAICEKVGSNE